MSETILGCQIEEQLYEGTQCCVYRTRADVEHRPTILKVLKQDHASSHELSRFRQEYELARKCQSDGVIKVYGLEPYEQSLVMLLEDIGGDSLVNWLPRGQLSVSECLMLMIKIASSLAHIHAAKVIHKHFNPSNLIWNPDTGELKVIDFGIATPLAQEMTTLRHPDVIEGTLSYVSPEQTGRMNRLLDYRTDLYSLGVTFYELLTGRLPFSSQDPMELVYHHLARMPQAPHILNVDIPELLSDLVMRLLQKNAEDRYQSALGLVHDLERCLANWQANETILPFELGHDDFSGILQIPQKLYGREQELSRLLTVFERTRAGAKELAFVTGYAGVGKTALGHELHKPLTKQRGYFFEGKFEQYQQNSPYSGWIQAFTSLINQMLTEPESELELWKQMLLEALGSSGQILTDVLPHLELIIGKQPDAPILGGTEAENRFHYLLQNFVKAIVRHHQPLVIFLDDLQWIDAASLKLLNVLLTDSELTHFLVIGAYRDNEVESDHPLKLAMDALQEANVSQTSLVLRNLSESGVQTLVADSLRCSLQESALLANLIYSKTNGNAFFSHQILHTLFEQGVLEADMSARRWKWDMATLQAMDITDNVVELMITRLRKLSAVTRDILKSAACLGNQFELTLLSHVTQRSEDDALRTLQEVLTMGLVFPLFGRYKFAHDRVQQAAYALIPEAEREAMHWQIGQRLFRHIPRSDRYEHLFDIVNQLNKGRVSNVTPAERSQLAELNHQAGHKAKNSTAYAAALAYANIGVELLSEDSWTTQYQLSLGLYQDAAEACYLCGQYENMAQHAQIAHRLAASVLDEVPVYETEIKALTVQAKLREAIRLGLYALERLGMSIPEQPSEEEVQRHFQKALNMLERQGIEHLLDLPLMTEPDKLASIQILSAIGEPAYAAVPGLFKVWASMMTQLSLQYGNTAIAPFAYAAYGLVLCASQVYIDIGYELTRKAISLLAPLNARSSTCRVLNIYGGTIQFWQEPLRNTIPVLEEGMRSGKETGDYTSGSYDTFALSMYAYFMGEPLSDLLKRLTENLNTIASFRQTYLWNWVAGYFSAAHRLHGSSESVELPGEFDADVWVSAARAGSDKCGLCHFFTNQLVVAFLLGEYEHTADYAAEVRENFAGFQGTFAVPVFYLYESLATLHHLAEADSDSFAGIPGDVLDNQQKLQHLAQLTPVNFQHKYELVSAEIARLEGHYWQAAHLYERAIAGAGSNLFLQEEALAYELAGRFYQGQGMESIARTYIVHAYQSYQNWQAWAKLRELETHFPQWLPGQLGVQKESVDDGLDVQSVMKAAQTISGEIALKKLLSSLMSIMLENAGAQKGALILEHQGQWLIEAEQPGVPSDVTVLQARPLSSYTELAVSIVNYVIRTREVVLLDHAVQIGDFIHDPYILEHQVKSILCAPLLTRGMLSGVIYLENTQVTAVFTPERVRVVELLAAQAAVSLENARYYEELRTVNASLELEIAERTRIEEALRESEQKFRSITQNIPGVVYKFHARPDGSYYFSYISPRSAEIFGLSSDPLSPDWDLGKRIHPDDREAFFYSIDEAVRLSQPWAFEGRFMMPNGQLRWFQGISSPSPDGDELAFNGILLDISRRKKAEAEIHRLNAELEQRVQQRTTELELANKELSSFAYIVSHDLKAPLRGINQLSEWLNTDYTEMIDENGKEMIRLLRGRVKGMEAMIDGILRYSRVGCASRAHEPIALKQLLPDLIEMLAIPERIQVVIVSDLPDISGDRVQIMQVFQNLIGNAAKFLGSSEGKIEIGCRDDRDFWIFYVADNGPGIEPEYHEKIFQIFQSLAQRDTEESTGIGLAIVKKILESYGGTIWVESAVGEGSVFWFTLPKYDCVCQEFIPQNCVVIH